LIDQLVFEIGPHLRVIGTTTGEGGGRGVRSFLTRGTAGTVDEVF